MKNRLSFAVVFGVAVLATGALAYQDDTFRGRLEEAPCANPLFAGECLAEVYALKKEAYFQVSPPMRAEIIEARRKALDGYLDARREFLEFTQFSLHLDLLSLDAAGDFSVPGLPDDYLDMPHLDRGTLYQVEPAFRITLSQLNGTTRCLEKLLATVDSWRRKGLFKPLGEQMYEAKELDRLMEKTGQLLPRIQQRTYPRGDRDCESAAAILVDKIQERLDLLGAIQEAGGDAAQVLPGYHAAWAARKAELEAARPEPPVWLTAPSTPEPTPTAEAVLPTPTELGTVRPEATGTSAPKPPSTKTPAKPGLGTGATVYITEDRTFLKNMFSDRYAMDIGQPLLKGKALKVLGKEEGYYYVRPLGGETGWIRTNKVSTVPLPGLGALEDEAARKAAGKPSAYVQVPGVSLKDQPKEGSQVVAQADYGDRLAVLSEQGAWREVLPPARLDGWGKEGAFALEPPKDVDGFLKVFVVGDDVPLLPKMDVDSKPIATLQHGDPVYMKELKEDYGEVLTLGKQSGYVFASFLSEYRPGPKDNLQAQMGPCPGVTEEDRASLKERFPVVNSLLLEGFRHYRRIKDRFKDAAHAYDVTGKTFEEATVDLAKEGGRKIFRITIPLTKRDFAPKFLALPEDWLLQNLYEFAFGQWAGGIGVALLSSLDWRWAGKRYLESGFQVVFVNGAGEKAVFTTRKLQLQGSVWEVQVGSKVAFSFDFLIVGKVPLTAGERKAVRQFFTQAK